MSPPAFCKSPIMTCYNNLKLMMWLFKCYICNIIVQMDECLSMSSNRSQMCQALIMLKNPSSIEICHLNYLMTKLIHLYMQFMAKLVWKINLICKVYPNDESRETLVATWIGGKTDLPKSQRTHTMRLQRKAKVTVSLFQPN